jgi:hypothetical protein
MNASQIITLLEKQLKLRPSVDEVQARRGNNDVTLPKPTANDDTCPRCHGEMIFTLESGTRYCLNCGKLPGE